NKTASNNVVPPAGSNTLVVPAEPAAPAKDKDVLKEAPAAGLSERIVFGYTAPLTQKDSSNTNAVSLRANTTVAKSKGPLQFKLPGKVDGVTSSPAPGYNNKTAAESLYIAGTIISRDDGSPLIGAAIRIKGTNRSTVTDVNGKFALSSPDSQATLDVVYIGYEPRQVSATRGDSVKVALKPDSRALAEVVVTNPKTDDNRDVSVTAAHPQMGWGSLKKYLQTNAVLPDGTTGTVTVTFTVFPSGITDEFSVKKGLNEIADQKAIELIKNGPSWVGSTNNKPEVVTVKVKFQKQK
ncbi:MAG TPA: carboxypeptidase-like regulatory domain-containing protein, partial [Mucilaginibacter sp.]